MAIKLSIITAFDDKELKRAQREIAAVGKSISRGLDMAVTGALAGATAGLVGAVKASSDYLAQMTGVEQVFGSAAKSVADFSKTAAKSAGLSATEALTAAKTFGLFANSAGLAGQSSANFATSLTQLAGDLGSFNEIPTAQVLADIQSGLQGQAEPLRKYGIFLTDAKLKEEAKNLAIYKGTGALSDQQKMLASYSLILKSTQVQQGDFAKYSTDLGNSTKTLTATLADLQVEIGNAVRPALTEIIPVLQEMIPLLGEKLKEAVDSVDWKEFFTAIVDGIGFIVTHLKEIATFVASMWALSKAIQAVKLAMSLATVATGLFTGALALNPIVAMGGAIAGLVGWIFMAKDAYDQASTSAGKFAKAQADKKYAQSLLAKNGLGDTIKEIWGGKGTDNDAKRLADMAKAAEARAAAAAVSAGIVLPNINAGVDSAAQKKADKAAKEAAAKAAKARKALIDAAQKAADEAQKAFEKVRDAALVFADSFKEVSQSFRDTFKASSELGAFERQTIDAFDAIKQSAIDASKAGLFDAKTLDGLLAYADRERALLQGIAKDRDVLAKKISIAQAVTSGVMGSLNITSMLETETKKVTRSVSSLVNGIALTTTQTFDEVVSGGLADSFRKLVDKTKAFASNLNKLKALGLNGNLFKQIVDAGAEGGNATAEAIIAGGAEAVTELNGLFQDLSDAGNEIAKTTTPVLYALGEDITNSFIDGLRSEDQKLIDTATAMAALFTSEFKKQLDLAIAPTLSTMQHRSSGTDRARPIKAT